MGGINNITLKIDGVWLRVGNFPPNETFELTFKLRLICFTF